MALHMGLLGWFNMVVGSEQLAAIFDDRESNYYKTPLTGVVLGCSLLPACSLRDGEEHTRKRRLVLAHTRKRRPSSSSVVLLLYVYDIASGV